MHSFSYGFLIHTGNNYRLLSKNIRSMEELVFHSITCYQTASGIICPEIFTFSFRNIFLAEAPAESFIITRDYVNCSNCSTLKEFHADNLKKGFTEEMKNAALLRFKINPVRFFIGAVLSLFSFSLFKFQFIKYFFLIEALRSYFNFF